MGGYLPPPFQDELASLVPIQRLATGALEKLLDADSPVALRLAGTGETSERKRHLLFRGALLFDQFSAATGEESAALRLSLVRSFEHDEKPYFSEVVIGQTGDDAASGSRIRFNLALPTPRPQSGKSGHPCSVLPFAAIYRPTLENTTPPPVERFVAGPGPAVATQDNNGKGVVLASTQLLAEKRVLGEFGLCAHDGGNGTEFLSFPAHGTHLESFWPLHAADFRKEFLDHLSAQVANPSDRFELKRPGGQDSQFWHSVRFDARGADTRVLFRTGLSIRATSAARSDITGDLAVVGDQFYLRLPTAPSAWIEAGTDLFIEVELVHQATIKQLWTQRDAPLLQAARAKTLLGFTATVDAGTGALGSLSHANPITQALDRAIKAMRLARLALLDVATRAPQSFLPEIAVQQDATARFALAGVVAFDRAPDGHLSWPRPARRAAWPGIDFRLTLWPEANTILGERAFARKIAVALRLPLFQDSPVDIPANLIGDESASAQQSGLFQFRIEWVSQPQFSGRLGGFLFDVSIDSTTGSFWRFGACPGERVVLPRGAREEFPLAEVDCRVRLAATRAQPAGTDRPWSDTSNRPAPLLMAKAENEGNFLIDAREQISRANDRRLIVDLYDRGVGASGTNSYVILSEQPFGLMRVLIEPLQQRGGPDGALVANYASDTRVWQVKLTNPTYHYEFPPQVIGESMDKPRRLEILDETLDAEKSVAPPLLGSLPVPPALNSLQRRAVEFRLTPSTEIWVRASDVERGFALPEWAAHDLFVQRGEFGLGSGLEALRGEFLYGLSVGVDVGRESGAARGARVAEIEALTGHPPARAGSFGPPTVSDARWRALAAALARRPERLEVWAREPGSSGPISLARFADGVQFALRKSALHRHPLEETAEVEATDDPSLRISKYGLSGGALWPIESRNFFDQLVMRPSSEGGTIERIALAPIGGDADQKAQFLNQNLAIISETRNGFVQRHKVEIIGRIAVFWHRAKHVVVYERTVSPSAQFTPESSKVKRSRRPILRKVSEYIELLQPERSFPDFPSATQATCGCLRAVRFNSRTINVDSAWGEEVDDFGWKIPLWNRHSARQRPQVYPRPDVSFVTSAEGEGEQPQTAQECREPDNIYFFADAKASGPDTDTWIARRGIDFGSAPTCQCEFEPAQAEEGRSRKPSAPRVPRGHRRFTWQLGPASHKTALNAGRADEPLYARLDSITFMRSNPLDPADPVVKKLSDAMALSAKALPPPPQSDVARALSVFLTSAHNNSPDVTQTAQALKDTVSAFSTNLVKGELNEYFKKVGNYTDGLQSFASEGPPRCKQVVDDFVGSIKRKQLLILEALHNWGQSARDALPEPGAAFNTKEELIDALADSLVLLIAPALDGFSKDIGSVESSVEKARAIVGDVDHDVGQLLTSAASQIDALKLSYDKEKPWSAQRLFDIHQKLQTVREGVLSDVESAVSEAQSRLTLELDRLAHEMSTAIARALHAVDAGTSGTLFEIDATENAAQAVIVLVEAKLAAVSAQLTAVDGKLAVAIQKDQQSGGHYAELLQGLKDRLAAVAALSQDLQTQLQQGMGSLQQTVEALSGALMEIQKQATTLLGEAQTFAESALKQVETISEEVLPGVKQELSTAVTQAVEVASGALEPLQDFGKVVDALVDRYAVDIQGAMGKLPPLVASVVKVITEAADAVSGKLKTLKDALSQDAVATFVRKHILRPAVSAVLTDETNATFQTITQENLQKLRGLLLDLSSRVEAQFDQLSNDAAKSILDTAEEACKAIGSGLQQAADFLKGVQADLKKRADELVDAITKALATPADLIKLADQFGNDLGTITKDLSGSYTAAHAYADRVIDSAANLGTGGLAAAPSNILKLYAAAASAPALPNLDFARERLAYYYNQLNNIIDTTPVEAWFGRLGEELKALGLSLPFRQIGSRLLPDDLSEFDISHIFKNFSGLKLDRLFEGFKLPAGARDAIRLTHTFDKQQARAWVQIDVDLTLGGRKSLFTLGPVTLDFVDSRLLGQVHVEASKDTDRVEQTGRATLVTNIEVVVGGQSMVTLAQVALKYDKSSGLNVEFDPRNLRLNPSFQFIQDTLGSLFPDEVGGMKVLKDSHGLPIGVEHEFSMPPISLMYGTSGVSNLQISNRFALVAFPDFVISDRFCLSRPELPFIFSLFIIGGTGYITVDAEYRPFNSELMVNVESAAGGSASIGFAFGPISGGVVISLSIALAYRKLIGKPGGGLTVSFVLLVAGTVNVAGIINVYMGLLLRLSYQESGQLDASGTLTITIRITRFFKLTARAHASYKMRDGKSTSSQSVSLAAASNPHAKAFLVHSTTLSDARRKAAKLLQARG